MNTRYNIIFNLQRRCWISDNIAVNVLRNDADYNCHVECNADFPTSSDKFSA